MPATRLYCGGTGLPILTLSSAGLSYSVCLKGAADSSHFAGSPGIEGEKEQSSVSAMPGYNNFMKIKDLPSGSYTLSVQSIDNCYDGSPFAAEQSFSHVNTGVADVEDPGIPD